MQLDLMQQAIGKAMAGLSLQRKSVDPGQVWANVRSDPDKLLGYVAARTQKTGAELLKEVSAYSQAMRQRYG